jgi:hypothetical protein
MELLSWYFGWMDRRGMFDMPLEPSSLFMQRNPFLRYRQDVKITGRIYVIMPL